MISLFERVRDELKKIIQNVAKYSTFCNNNDRSLYSIDAGAGAIAYDVVIEIECLSWYVPSIDHSNDNGIIAQKGLNKRII